MPAKNVIVLDTETNGLKDKFVFDLGYTIANRKETLVERSFLVREIITSPSAMLGALQDNYWRDMFGSKLFRDYIPALDSNDMRLYSWRDIVETIRDDMRRYNVATFAAYNLGFDMRAIANTHKHIVETGKVLEYKPDLLCLWQFACDTVCNSKAYHNAAKQFGWVSDAGNVRTNAEKVYSFLTGQFDFVEDHTALSDARIETEILQRLFARKRKIPYNTMDHMPWRKAQIVA